MGLNLDLQSVTAERPVRDRTQNPRRELVQIIEGEIIPRLFLSYRNRALHPLADRKARGAEMPDLECLARDFLQGDSARLTDRLQLLLDGGMPRAQVFLDILAPMPRTVSRFWAEGACNFDDVATGLFCIEEVLRRLHERETVSGTAKNDTGFSCASSRRNVNAHGQIVVSNAPAC